jgi:multiple antibiotic resistance protein
MIEQIIINALYLLALINPVSKISILTVFAKKEETKEIFSLSLKSSVAAMVILFISMLAGEFVINKVFKVDFYSLQIAGGIILFWVGFGALRKGIFFEHSIQEKFSDISLVPIACPMIAGPATITAVIALNINIGFIETAISTILALTVNLILMLYSISIGKILVKFNIMGALVRITGLIVITIAIQMILQGISIWIKSI